MYILYWYLQATTWTHCILDFNILNILQTTGKFAVAIAHGNAQKPGVREKWIRHQGKSNSLRHIEFTLDVWNKSNSTVKMVISCVYIVVVLLLTKRKNGNAILRKHILLLYIWPFTLHWMIACVIHPLHLDSKPKTIKTIFSHFNAQWIVTYTHSSTYTYAVLIFPAFFSYTKTLSFGWILKSSSPTLPEHTAVFNVNFISMIELQAIASGSIEYFMQDKYDGKWSRTKTPSTIGIVLILLFDLNKFIEVRVQISIRYANTKRCTHLIPFNGEEMASFIDRYEFTDEWWNKMCRIIQRNLIWQ